MKHRNARGSNTYVDHVILTSTGFLSNELENSSNSLLPPINPAKDSPKGEKSNQDQPFAVKQNQKKAMQPTEESVKHAVQHLAVDKVRDSRDLW